MLKTLSPGDMGCAYGLKIVSVVVEKGGGEAHKLYFGPGGERNRQQTNNLYEGVNVGKAKKKKKRTMGERKRSKHHKTIPKKKKHILPATGHTGVCYLFFFFFFFFFFWLGSTQNNFLFYVTKTKKVLALTFFF